MRRVGCWPSVRPGAARWASSARAPAGSPAAPSAMGRGFWSMHRHGRPQSATSGGATGRHRPLPRGSFVGCASSAGGESRVRSMTSSVWRPFPCRWRAASARPHRGVVAWALLARGSSTRRWHALQSGPRSAPTPAHLRGDWLATPVAVASVLGLGLAGSPRCLIAVGASAPRPTSPGRRGSGGRGLSQLAVAGMHYSGMAAARSTAPGLRGRWPCCVPAGHGEGRAGRCRPTASPTAGWTGRARTGHARATAPDVPATRRRCCSAVRRQPARRRECRSGVPVGFGRRRVRWTPWRDPGAPSSRPPLNPCLPAHASQRPPATLGRRARGTGLPHRGRREMRTRWAMWHGDAPRRCCWRRGHPSRRRAMGATRVADLEMARSQYVLRSPAFSPAQRQRAPATGGRSRASAHVAGTVPAVRDGDSGSIADNGHDVLNTADGAWWPSARPPLRLIWFPEGWVVARVPAPNTPICLARGCSPSRADLRRPVPPSAPPVGGPGQLAALEPAVAGGERGTVARRRTRPARGLAAPGPAPARWSARASGYRLRAATRCRPVVRLHACGRTIRCRAKRSGWRSAIGTDQPAAVPGRGPIAFFRTVPLPQMDALYLQMRSNYGAREQTWQTSGTRRCGTVRTGRVTCVRPALQPRRQL